VPHTRAQNFELNGTYRCTPAFFVGAQYVYTLENYDAGSGSVKPRVRSWRAGAFVDGDASRRARGVAPQGARLGAGLFCFRRPTLHEVRAAQDQRRDGRDGRPDKPAGRKAATQ